MRRLSVLPLRFAFPDLGVLGDLGGSPFLADFGVLGDPVGETGMVLSFETEIDEKKIWNEMNF